MGDLRMRDRYRLALGPVNAAIYDLEQGTLHRVLSPLSGYIAHKLGLGGGGPPPMIGAELQPHLDEWIARSGFFADGHEGVTGPDAGLRGRHSDVKKMIWLEITPQCNFRCIHCYVESGPEVTGTLPDERWMELIREAAALGFPLIQLTGGDPTMHPRFIDFVRLAASLRFGTVEVYTNGTLLTEEWLDEFAALGTHIAMSFYSNDPATYERITQKPGSWEKAVETIRRIVSRRIPLRMGIIVMDGNSGHETATVEFLTSLGVDRSRIGIDAVRPTGRGSDLAPVPPPAPGRMLPDSSVRVVPLQALEEKLIERIDAARRDTRADASVVKVQSQDRASGFYWDIDELPGTFRIGADATAEYNVCWQGEVVIASSGEVFPCIFARGVPLGSVERRPLEQVIASPLVQNAWSHDLSDSDECSVCEFQYACFDCRALTTAVTGDRRGKPPGCNYLPLEGRMARKSRATTTDFLKLIPSPADDIEMNIAGEYVVVRRLDGETSLYLTNATGAWIVARADGATSIDQMIEEIAAQATLDAEAVRREVPVFIENLLQHGLLRPQAVKSIA